MEKSAILLVDDESIILLSLKQELQDHFGTQFIYETAMSGTEALEIVNDLSDAGVKLILIITDWLMPGLKGDELLTEVSKIHSDIKTILISGQVDENSLKELQSKIKLSASFTKPWDSDELIETIEKIIGI
jgi:YesN/AraC family two-component response regulator